MHSSSTKSTSPSFVVATPQRSVCDENARVLERLEALRFLALGTRRGTHGVSAAHTRLNPAIGLLTYVCARILSTYRAECCRFALLPWFDRWVLSGLRPGDHIISSYGYVNACFRFVRRHGGKTFLDAGNSHIENFWSILSEEHRRWNCSLPPVSPFWYERSRRMLEEVDYVLSPSAWVTRSFLERGFRPEQILSNVYPVDLTCFHSAKSPRPANRPLTVICTGQLSLRKGTPYLLEAFRHVLKAEPAARLWLTDNAADSVRTILEQNGDLPIEWSPALPHDQLAERLRAADVFVLPSLEEGLARTALEAMACGLPVVVTSHTGANDFVQPGSNGEIVPIRDPIATAEAILKCWERVRTGIPLDTKVIRHALSFDTFAETFVAQLRQRGFFDRPPTHP